MEKQGKKIRLAEIISIIIYVVAFVACGFVVGGMSHVSASETFMDRFGIAIVIEIAVIMVALFLQIVIHEAGHLIFGLLSGYKFFSFRVANIMLIKEDGKIKIKSLHLSGTAGQCLMSPPDLVDGKMPFVLYNLGGVILNIIVGIKCIGLAIFCKNELILAFLLVVAIIGFALALLNGIPMCLAEVSNDGHNIISIGKSDKAMRAFWIQLKAAEQMAKGRCLKDMPQEWFFVPTEEEMKNSMIATIGVFKCNLLIELHMFDEACQLINKFKDMDTAIAGLYHSLLDCDLIFCDLISDNGEDKANKELCKSQKNFMKAMKGFPAILRTEYAYALLAEKDVKKAETFKRKFEKVAKTYPYQGDIECERELLKMTKERASL